MPENSDAIAERCLLLFTKPAHPGRVKTRLIGALSAVEAALLHQAFVDDVLAELAGGRFELRIAWALEDGESVPRLTPPGVRQIGRDLGERLFQALAGAASSHRFVAAVGSDHPTLSLRCVENGFERLEAGADVVIGPAIDGGYYWIGVRAERLTPRLFQEIPWSEASVFATTIARCRELGLAVELLPEGVDIDTGDDLEALVEHLARYQGGCTHTRELLAAWGRLPTAQDEAAPC